MTLAQANLKVHDKISKPVRLDDGLYPASAIVESVNWQRSLIRDVSPSVFQDAFWTHVNSSERVVKKSGGGKTKYSGIFYTLHIFSEFWEAAFGKRYVKVKDSFRGSSSVVFVCPYGLIQKPTISDADTHVVRSGIARRILERTEFDQTCTKTLVKQSRIFYT